MFIIKKLDNALNWANLIFSSSFSKAEINYTKIENFLFMAIRYTQAHFLPTLSSSSPFNLTFH